MSRPATAQDLPTYTTQGTTLVTVQLTELAVSAKILAAAAALLAAVEKTPGVSAVQEHGQITVSKDKTTEELADTMRVYQSDWDTNQSNFLTWQSSGIPENLSVHAIYNVLSWATKEGLPEAETGFLRAAHRDAKIRAAQA